MYVFCSQFCIVETLRFLQSGSIHPLEGPGVTQTDPEPEAIIVVQSV